MYTLGLAILLLEIYSKAITRQICKNVFINKNVTALFITVKTGNYLESNNSGFVNLIIPYTYEGLLRRKGSLFKKI